MSTTALASLVVSMELNAAKFTSDMNATARVVDKAANEMTAAVGKAKAAIAGLAAAFQVAEIVGWAKETVAAASALDDLADSTGSSVESLSRLSNQAKISGVDFGTLQGLMLKLASGMAGVENEGSNVGKALAALGVTAKDPAVALNEIALALDKYADGTGKAALARDLFGKGGPAFLAALKDIAKAQDVAATVTTQQAAEAEKLEQALRRMSVESTTFKNALLSDVVPALNEAIVRFRAAREAGLSFFQAIQIDGRPEQLVNNMLQLRTEIASLQQNMEQVKKQGREWFLPGLQADIDEKTKKLRALEAILNKVNGGGTDNSGAPPASNAKPNLDYGTKDTKAVTQAVADYADEIQKLNDEMLKLSGAGGGYTNFLRANEQYQKDLRAGKVINEEQARAFLKAAIAVDEETAALKKNAESWDSYMEAARRSEAMQKAFDEAIQASNLRLKAENEALQLEHDTLGMTDNQRQKYITTLALAKAITEENVGAVAKLTERLELLNQQAADQTLMESLRQQAEEWKRTYDKIADTITDALMRGFEGGKSFAKNFRDTIANLFKTLVLRPVIQAIIAPVAGGIAGLLMPGSASASGIGGIGGIGNALSAGSSIYNAATGGISAFGTGVAMSGIGQSLGLSSSVISQAGSLSLGVEAGALPAGTLGLTSLGAGFVAALPWAALAAIAIPIIIRAFDKGPANRTADFASNSALGAGNPLFQSSSELGTFGLFNDKWFSNEDMAKQIGGFLQSVRAIDNAIAAAVGPAVTEQIRASLNSSTNYGFGTEDDDPSKSGAFGAIMLARYTAVLNTINAGLGDLLVGFEGTGEQLTTFVLGLVAMNTAMQDTEQMVALFGAAFSLDELKAAQNEGEKITDTFSRLSTVFNATNAVAFVLGKDTATAFGSVGLASTAAREQLIKLAGGLESLAAQVNFFYENFLTDADRLDLALPQVTATMAALGYSSITTVEQFKKLVMGIDLSTEEGRKLYTSLMAIAPQFFYVATQTDKAADALKKEAAARQTLLNVIRQSPMGDAIASNGTQWDKLNQAGAALDSLTTFYDNSADATTALTTATENYYNSLVQMLAVIEQLKESIAGMFADSIRMYTTSGMSPEDKYRYIQKEVTGWQEELKTATDPARINWLAGQINSGQREAWGLLSPDQQEQARSGFIAGATQANALAQQRLDEAAKIAQENWAQLITNIREAITEAGGPFVTAGKQMNTAADKNVQAANTPMNVTVTLKAPVASDVNA